MANFLSGGDEGETPAPQTEEPDVLDPFEATGTTDESSIIPTGVARYPFLSQIVVGIEVVGMRICPTLSRDHVARCHDESDAYRYVTLRPTENWDLSWRTAMIWSGEHSMTTPFG
ncbi:MAG: hypothetical protein CM1200mP14_28570 [Gammaproteobacteria bacterium]|nr:MAG: hypothetical protein CM1200mP14_28570 [Gammaproteobacteria bacterium]